MTGKKKDKKKLIIGIAILGGLLFTAKATMRTVRNGKGHRGDRHSLTNREEVYEQVVKPCMDHVLSFLGLIILSPLFGLISLAIYFDDPGPVFFTQKRVGKDKTFFELHKFRSMKMSTPHDVPTHQLQNPEQYITKVGAFLRKTSLDELPQIWDIFRGKMSIIGPRPALWNQEDLIAERDKYGANEVKPGLTGWAQINGRDELEIPDKAKLDGEYVAALHKGGWVAFQQDLRCFMGTITSVVRHDGVVEGGTGACPLKDEYEGKPRAGNRDVRIVDESEAGFEDYGYQKTFHIDRTLRKHVLITGANSYIGESFAAYAKEHYPDLAIDTIDMIDGTWRDYDFSPYDAVFHVAGIAHADVGDVSEEEKARYYAVNTDLAIETCQKAKDAGVRQFIFMSSMIVYGDSAPFGKKKNIDEYTVPSPANFYGDSKWQADKGVRALQTPDFHVAVLRPPMIYGRGSKGNYPVLAKLAKKLPVFPDVENQRSMLYIENLCEFLCLLVLSGENGVYFPQNQEYSDTSDLVGKIGEAFHKNIHFVGSMDSAIKLASRIPGRIGKLTNKAFGNLTYSQRLSTYDGLEYRVAGLAESLERTEKTDTGHATGEDSTGQHILVVSQYFHPEAFRINDIAAEWVKRGYEVTVLTGIPNYPSGKFFDGYGYARHRHEWWNGIEIIRIPIIPRGSSSIGMMMNYLSFVISGLLWKVATRVKADLVYTFEVSPMTQALVGTWYAKKHCIPHYIYVTDLWPENVESVTGVHSKVFIWPIQKMVDYIYRNSDRILTCSRSFIEPIRKRGIDISKIEFWPQYAESFYRPVEKKGDLIPQDGRLNLVFAGNIGYAQGLDILIRAAEVLKKDGRPVRFNIIGDGRYLPEMREDIRKMGISDYFNFIPRQPAERIPDYLAFADALLITLASSEVFAITIPAKTQSCMACGRPILVSADGEIQEIVREAGAGLCSDAEDVVGFVKNIETFLSMSIAERERLAANAFAYAGIHFDKEKLLDRLDEVFMQERTEGKV